MDITIDNHRFTLTNDLIIGQGGEAVIYKHPGAPEQFALKIYRERDAKRAEKLSAMLGANLQLPDSAIVPLQAVRGQRGNIVGFSMRRLTNRYRKLGMVFRESFSRDHGFTSKVKAQIFLSMATDLSRIHPSGIVIGDINDGNEMVDEVGKGLVWIDMDSVQFGRFPCMAGTQLYLSPDLYGVDLGKAAAFRPEHDWYAFAVIMVRALTNGVHPFKSGLHAQYASIFERAQHGATVFDSSVTYPEVGLPPEVLSNDLVDAVQRVLKRESKQPFPLGVLEHYRNTLIECGSCGLYYPLERRKCPACAHTTVLDAKMAAAAAGFSVSTLLETKGRIVYLTRSGSRINAVLFEGNDLHFCTKDDGAPLVQTPVPYAVPLGAWFGTFDGSFVVCPDPSAEQPQLFVFDIASNAVVLRKLLTTELFSGGQAVFATSNRFLYRIAGRELLCSERFGTTDVLERSLMQIHKGQTWFTVARNVGDTLELIAGFHREFSGASWFLVRGDGKTFSRFENLAIPQLDSQEAMRDHAVYFSAESVMVVRATRKRGVDRVRVDVVSTTDGAPLRSFILEGPTIGPWERMRGKAFFNGLVMHPTDQGVVRERIADGTQQSLAFTQTHVHSSDDLDRLGGGIMVARSDRVLHIQP